MTLRVELSHRFGAFELAARFEAPPGLTALFGRSGSGKTTIVNAVAGLLRPEAGRIEIGGRVLFDAAAGTCVPPHLRRVGYVFQEARLFPHLTVQGNLGYGAWFARRRPPRAEAARIVELLGIGHLLARRPDTLSGGERSRVALGRAILARPDILLMDEPLAALDEARKAEILPYLERLRDETRLPILYVSHSVAEVARLATTVVMVEGGAILCAGPAGQILSDPTLAPAFGVREAGAILRARVSGTEADGLSLLDSAGGPVWLPRIAAPAGTELRLRILAQDVLIALAPPAGISALNILAGRVEEVRTGEGPGAMVRLAVGDAHLLARITRRSARALGLEPGQQVWAVVKSMTVAPASVGEG
jgi:molybdate transport system ATP-binding protein